MNNDDKAEIIEIINLYAFALDTHQWDLCDRVFTENVVAVFGLARAGWTGLNIFKVSFAEFHARLDSHQHTMTGHLVMVDGDTAHAFSYGKLVAHTRSGRGRPHLNRYGLVRRRPRTHRAGWRIKHRVCQLQDWTGNPNALEQHNEHNPDINVKVLHSFAEAGDLHFLKARQGK